MAANCLVPTTLCVPLGSHLVSLFPLHFRIPPLRMLEWSVHIPLGWIVLSEQLQKLGRSCRAETLLVWNTLSWTKGLQCPSRKCERPASDSSFLSKAHRPAEASSHKCAIQRAEMLPDLEAAKHPVSHSLQASTRGTPPRDRGLPCNLPSLPELVASATFIPAVTQHAVPPPC